MRKKRTRPGYLKVIEGRGKVSRQQTADPGKKIFQWLLIFLAFFLLAQVLFGWIWRNIDQGAISTVLADEGVVDVSFATVGIITFSEKVVLAPCSGFIYYNVDGGERVPVGKVVAKVTDFPLKDTKVVEENEEEAGLTEYMQQFKSWFMGETSKELPYFLPAAKETVVVAPFPGLVKVEMDGFEKFGPDSYFPYFTAEEIEEKGRDVHGPIAGEKVLRSTPLLKLIDNYYCYFSTVLSAEQGKLIAEESKNKFIFSFAPETPVWCKKVETRNRGDGQVEVTWCIDRELPGLHEHRWCDADIVYKDVKGVLIPKSALLEMDGKKGVYVAEKGLVTFREIIVLLEEENDLLVRNLNLYERVFTEPENIKEGQGFYG